MTQWLKKTRGATAWLYENDRFLLIYVVNGWRLVERATKRQHDLYASADIGMRAAERIAANGL